MRSALLLLLALTACQGAPPSSEKKPLDEEEALRRRCAGGDVEGCIDLGRLLSPTKRRDEGHALLSRACDARAARGCRILGYVLRLSPGEVARAAQLTERGCELDDAMACKLSSENYARGWGVTADHEKAKRYHERACQLGLADACTPF